MNTNHAPTAQQRLAAIAFVANATEFFATTQESSPDDIDAAIESAVDAYINDGKSYVQAVTIGVEHARSRILHRKALLLCDVIFGVSHGRRV